MDATKWRARTTNDLIIEAWEALDCESVGSSELEQIQQALLDKFGEGAVSSPASIARTVADEGAVLRHPEIFECDSAWRVRKLDEQNLLQLSFARLSEAVTSFGKLELKRHELGEDTKGIDRIRDLVTRAREASLFDVRSKVLSASQREEAKEISEWLAVWLRSPQMFADWLELRMRTPDFQRKFGKTSEE